MDGVELARQKAAELHDRAVKEGGDPRKPYAFAVAEATRRGIDVEPTKPGGAMLDGSRATLIAADRLILHESFGTPFEQAFLVAHEIGHLELGDAPLNEGPVAIDPSRSSEPSPVGMDRVVDYSRRQRREVQMDLFAREFLLPRPLLRRLCVDDRLSATAIAERFGAPFDVVAQQLLDALLLPPLERAEATEEIERPLNVEQLDASCHEGCAYLLEAGPGTGKTQTLVGRVERLLKKDVDPRRILLLTFSNKAAGEMADRIAVKHKDAAGAMWIGTFHAFGLDLVRRFHDKLGLPENPRMMDRTEAVELLEQSFPSLDLQHYQDLYDPTQIIADLLGAISRAKDEVVGEDTYLELAQAMDAKAETGDEREAARRALEIALVYKAYEKIKREARAVDFGDLVYLPVTLLETNPDVAALLQKQYDHVLVDEYQDVNHSSVRLLKALRPDGENLWVVGDAKQSIYRFRGASSFNVSRFGSEDFAGGKKGRLKRNYRSTPEIIKAFSAFATRMLAGGKDSDLDPGRNSIGAPVEFRAVISDDEQAVALADAIEEMREAGYSYRQQAVLCTGNEKLSERGQALERMGIPVLFLGSLFERPEVKDLLSFLTILTDPRAIGLVRVACMPEFKMSMAGVGAVLEHLRANKLAPASWLSSASSIPGLGVEDREAVNRIRAACDGLDQKSSPWTVLATLLLDRTSIAATIGSSMELAFRSRGIALWQFMNFLKVQPSGQGLPMVRLLDRVRRLVRIGDERDLRQLPAAAQGLDAVRLMTIHGAKGLEFPVVHLPGMNSDTLPRPAPKPACLPPDGMVQGATGNALTVYQAGHAEEQECLFYVALSRARDRLLLYAPTKKSNGHARPASPFIDRLGPGVARKSIQTSRGLPPAPQDGRIPLQIAGGMRFTAPEIALYETCPRRFFYTHILRIGGRRTATAYMQMHEAVRAVYQAALASNEMRTSADVEQHIDAAFAVHGLAAYGYKEELKVFAIAMLNYFIESRAGRASEVTSAIRLSFGTEEIIVRPDDALVSADGSRTLRRIMTGHARSKEGQDVGSAAFVLAARKAFPGAVVEIVHLSGREITPIKLDAKPLKTREEKIAAFLARIRAGDFPTDPSERRCPNCPAFFVCGPTPDGVLPKKFDDGLPVEGGTVD